MRLIKQILRELRGLGKLDRPVIRFGIWIIPPLLLGGLVLPMIDLLVLPRDGANGPDMVRMLLYLPLVVIPVYLLWRWRESAPARIGMAWWPALRLGILAVTGWWLIAVPFSSLLISLYPVLDNPAVAQFGRQVAWNPWMVALVVLVVPVAEEVLFRRIGYRIFLDGGFPVIGALLVSAVFAAVHVQYFTEISPAALFTALWLWAMSMLLCWLYARSRRLLAPAVMHAVNNGLAIGAFLWLGA